MCPVIDAAIATLASLSLGAGEMQPFPSAPLTNVPIRFSFQATSESRPPRGAPSMRGPELKVQGMAFRGDWVLQIDQMIHASGHSRLTQPLTHVGFDGEALWLRLSGQPVMVSRNRSAALTPSLWWFPALIGIGDRYDGERRESGDVWTPLTDAIVTRAESEEGLTLTAEWRNARQQVGQRDTWLFHPEPLEHAEGSSHSLVRVRSQLLARSHAGEPTLHSETLVVLEGPTNAEDTPGAEGRGEAGEGGHWIQFGDRRLPSRLIATGRTFVDPPDVVAVAESVLTLQSIERMKERAITQELDRFFTLAPGEVLIDTDRSLTIQQGSLMFSLDGVVYVSRTPILTFPSELELEQILESATPAPTEDPASDEGSDHSNDAAAGGTAERASDDAAQDDFAAGEALDASAAPRDGAERPGVSGTAAPASRVTLIPPNKYASLNFAIVAMIAAGVMVIVAIVGWGLRLRVAKP